MVVRSKSNDNFGQWKLQYSNFYSIPRAMGISKGEDDLDLVDDPHLWVEEGRQVREIKDLLYDKLNDNNHYD